MVSTASSLRGLTVRLVALIAAVHLAGCTAIQDGTGVNPTGPGSQLISAPQPGQIPEHDRVVDNYGGIYRSPSMERTIAAMTGRLVAASADPSQSYRITILNSPTVNAFALPGGLLYVTRGLLALANDASEVAAVLAHEMAHVTASHGVARQRRAEATALVNRVLANVVRDPDAAKAALTSTQLSFARFSQIQELQADKTGIRTLAGAGYDPFAASRFLNSMGQFAGLQWSASAASNKPDFLSSHPTTPERVNEAVLSARQIGAPGLGRTDQDAYLGHLSGLLFGDDPTEGFVRGRRFLHKALRIAFSVPDGFILENTSRAVLATDGGNIAMRFDGVDLEPELSLTAYLKSGWLNGLAADSIRTSSRNRLRVATASAVTQGWSFRIALFRTNRQVYRFIFATRKPDASFERAFEITQKSFARLTRAQAVALRPLKVQVVVVRVGQTVDTFARRMRGTDKARQLFLVLNGLNGNAPLKPGSKVKIIVD